MIPRPPTLGAILLATAACAGEDLPPGFGDRIPDAEFEVVHPAGTDWEVGQRIDLGDLDGAPLILDFWASWCFPCRAQHRFVSEVVASYGPRVQAIGILYQDAPENALAWLEEHGASYPTVREVDGTLASTFWIGGIPRLVLLDRDRRLSWDMMGGWANDSVTVRLDAMVGS